ncbi:efflux RND transporter periplasmic adaptor subunit [Trichloromonas sp.]|uniref:efflux RND transporter periplasmic adaptor subunit n=1 Tax=Trichloromonas sp. TaxID=3069249 RepID=UPI003D81C379
MKKSGISTKLFVAVALLVALAGGYYLGGLRHVGNDEHAGHGHEASPEANVQYTCGMHPFIIQDEPGICPICNMKLTPMKQGTGSGGAQPVATGERKIKYWQAPMDPTYIRDEPGKSPMGMDLVPVYEDVVSGGGIQIDPVTTQNMGVRTEIVSRRDLSRTVRTLGLVTYDEPRQFSVNSKIEGWVERLYVNEDGRQVKKGQPLMEIYSPELVAAQNEYLLALQNSRRLSQSPFGEIAESSRRLLDASRTRLKYWDISDKQISALEQSGEVSKTLTLYSSYSGVVTMKKVVEGMRVMAGEELLQISDISKVWVNADIYEYELPWVKVGQTAQVELPFAPDRKLEGKISYIYPYLQSETRTVKARIEFPNPGQELKPDMYANIRIATGAVQGALAIPENAVLNSGKGQTVFVAMGEGRFEPRSVKTGVSDDSGYVQILSGLSEGDAVVVSAQFMLDSESKLREAIQKMIAPKSQQPSGQASAETTPELNDLFDEKPAPKQEELDDLFK